MPNMFGTLSSLGMGSGMDIQGLVKKLVDNESKYTSDKLDKRELDTQAKLSSWGLLKGALANFQDSIKNLLDPTGFHAKTAVVTNDPTVGADVKYFNAAVNNTAINGTYNVEVQQLAQADKYISDNYASKDYKFSTGTLSITVGYGQANSRTYNVAIDSNSNSLVGIKTAINRTLGSVDVGATLVTGDDGVKLVIAGTKAGAKYAIHVDVAADNAETSPTLLDLTQGLNHAVTSQDAQLMVDNQLVTASSNTLVDVIEGVTLNLTKAEVGKTHTLTINSDLTGATKDLEVFVTKYNELREQILDVTKVSVIDKKKTEPANKKKNDSGDKEKPSTNGELHNDPVVMQLVSTLRTCLTTTIVSPIGITALQNIGISSDRTGKLTINKNKYPTAAISFFALIFNIQIQTKKAILI